ncbi:MAG: efflux RND transporter periplasmic adaptor subunit [Pseudomonadota bacterium]
MTKKLWMIAAVLLVVGAALGYGAAYFAGGRETAPASGGEKKILYWTDPMIPGYRSPKPGKSPMGMDMIPVYEGEESDAGASAEPALKISPAGVNKLGVRTAPVTRGTLYRTIETVGYIVPNDNLVRHVNVRTQGWIERLLFKTPGEFVKKGALIFQMYSPALVNAQAEFLQALRIEHSALAGAARERLIALGMTDAQIDTLVRTGKVEQWTDIRAPQDGYAIALNVGEGMFIEPGTTVFSLADLSSIWVMVEVFEHQAEWVSEGQEAVMELPFLPGRKWTGKVDYVYPTIDPQSRTLRVRLKFDNPGIVLKPNMYAQIAIKAEPRENTLSIPREALIRSGTSNRVVLALGEGRFRPAKVTVGIESGNRVELLSGVKEGEIVVTSGQFLLDSEASLDESFLRMEVTESAAPETAGHEAHAAAPATASGMATLNAVKAQEGKVDLSHGPIEAFDLPAMTMDFPVAPGVDLSALKPGGHVNFTLSRAADGSLLVTAITASQH